MTASGFDHPILPGEGPFIIYADVDDETHTVELQRPSSAQDSLSKTAKSHHLKRRKRAHKLYKRDHSKRLERES